MIAELLKYNCSTLFILQPVTGVKWSEQEEEFGMINSYLKDKAREDLTGDLLFVLFKPKDFDYFELFVQEQEGNNSAFLEDYDYADGYVVLVYRIREELKKDFELFKQGKYSKLSELIRKSYDREVRAFIKPIPSFQWEVFRRATRLRKELEEFFETQLEKEAELWAIPDMNKETLDIEKILNPEINEQKLLENG